MDEVFKKELIKVFYVGSFLFITIFFILPYLVQVSTYFHEQSHVKVLSLYGVENDYRVNFIETIPNFYNPNLDKLGVTRYNVAQYNLLSPEQKMKVNVSGIISDLRFLFLIGVYLAIVNLYIFYKVNFKKEYDLLWVIGINWILFMWLLALIQITVANVTYPVGDIQQLVRAISS